MLTKDRGDDDGGDEEEEVEEDDDEDEANDMVSSNIIGTSSPTRLNIV